LRLSELRSLADDVFGADLARTLAKELALDGLDSLTADAAIAAGVAPRDVWHALCDQMDVPLDARDGGDRRRNVPPPR